MEQKLKSSLTKQRLLDAAETEFSEKGLAAARVDDIARKAGVNKQLLYSHFQSKEGLYSTVLMQVYHRLQECEDLFAKKNPEGKETIRTAILSYFSFLMENPTFVRLVLWENLNYARNLEVRSSPNGLFSGIRQLLLRGMEEGKIRKNLDVEQTVLSLNMFCFSAFSNLYTVSKLTGKDYTTTDELKKRAEHISRVLADYIFEENKEDKIQ